MIFGKGYEDMLYLRHHQSHCRAPMSMLDRAAQFSPFAALTGYEAVIEETGRLTDRPVELTEGEKARLDEQLQRIQDGIKRQPRITAMVFIADARKPGGAYIQITGNPKKIDTVQGVIWLTDGTTIQIETIVDIKADFAKKKEP